MQLYIIRGAPNSRKAEAVVAHLGLDIELVELDIRAGEHKKDDYLALNPNGLVPTLVDGDFTLWESHAVMAYLADGAGAKTLYPTDLRARAEVNRWMNWAQAHFGRSIGPVLLERFLKPVLRKQEGDESVAEAALPAFHQAAAILEARLDETAAFVCGPDVTLADFCLASTEGFWRKIALPLEPYPAIRAWAARLDEVPGWRETAPPFIKED